ncbi:MAG: AMP-binding protein [Pseudomonadota bacterium]
MSRLPLMGHTRPDQIVAWQMGKPITVARFLSDVKNLACQLPPRQHMLNMCGDRYRFTVGLAAALVQGQVSLLPPMHTPEMMRQMLAFAPDVFCLHDALDCSIALPQFRYPDALDVVDVDCAVPTIDCAQLAAIVFTSGSTGTPVPHKKYWGPLVHSVLAEVERLGLADATSSHTVVGTVPSQHMYGFESTVLMPLQSGHALSSGQPFYAADIVSALENVPAPRILVSTPVHLRMLLDAELNLPEVAGVLSATAPLSQSLAREVEARFDTSLAEIYGCTETGIIATRRPSRAPEWRLFPGIQLSWQDDVVTASGGHVTQPIALGDLIEPMHDGSFLLHGRTAEMINIAGKRNSLANLNHLLTAIAGVIDGSFYMPDDPYQDHVVRLAACVVAPALTAPQVLAALREQVDPVFLPRPLLFVDALPRNSTGKLPREALKNLIQAHLGDRP